MRLGAGVVLCAAACASYRILPPPPVEGAVAPLPVRYEKSRLFFTSSGDDGAIDRVFAAGPAVLATVARPAHGLYASTDGRNFTFVSGAFDFKDVISDGKRLWARGQTRVFRSEDGGKSWASVEVVRSGDWLDALALGPDGALYAAGRSQLYASEDGGGTWRAMGVLPKEMAWRVRSLAPTPQGLYVSIRSEPQGDLLARFKALLDLSSDEGVSALKLVDSQGPPGKVSWGPASIDGAYVTRDGGATWRRTGLAIDAFLAAHEGALYAMAADPILASAALMRRYPDLAGAADRQMKGGGVSAAGLREACAYPGRARLLTGPVAGGLVFRSADGGATWSKLDDVPLAPALALRRAIDRGGEEHQRLLQAPVRDQRRISGTPYVIPTFGPGAGGELSMVSPNLRQQYGMPGGYVPQRRRQPAAQAPPPRMISPEVLLAFVDPMRLVARFNGGLAVSGVSGDVGFAPTQAGWDALVASLADESQSEGEISLGPSNPPPPREWFELLRTADASPLPQQLPAGAPQSIAATQEAIFVVRGGDGRGWRIAR